MQATGMVNDHLVGYFRHGEVGGLGDGRSTGLELPIRSPAQVLRSAIPTIRACPSG